MASFTSNPAAVAAATVVAATHAAVVAATHAAVDVVAANHAAVDVVAAILDHRVDAVVVAVVEFLPSAGTSCRPTYEASQLPRARKSCTIVVRKHEECRAACCCHEDEQETNAAPSSLPFVSNENFSFLLCLPPPGKK